ncbi:FXL17 protein, partial [Atractosteus spatula]|nr:FXL17 protein [Atractosteus spatula]
MGHLLSKNGKRVKKKKRKLRRNCFLHGPCMLCFIVHNTSSLAEDQLESASKLAERYAALGSPEDCARFLLSPKELALWEEQGKSLLSGVPAKLFRTVSAGDYSEMVCKRKCPPGAQRGAPCFHIPLCILPSSSSSEGSTGGLPTGAGESPAGTASTATPQSPSESTPLVPSDSQGDCKAFEADMPSINHLPASILLNVFSHLSVRERCLSASLVCKYWYDLCLDFQFWKQIDLSGLQQVKDDLLIKIASRRQNVTEINISDCRNVLDYGICSLASQCTGLLKYTAYRCKQLSDLSLMTIAAHCPLLQKVHVGNQDKLTDEALKKLGERCSELRDVHFGQCYNLTDEGMIALAKGCPKLQRIYMQENKLVTDKSVKAFAEHCPELQFVGFMGCSVTSQGVIHLTRLKNLSSLDLRHISELNNETVIEVVRKCTSLSSLNLCLNWSINDR